MNRTAAERGRSWGRPQEPIDGDALSFPVTLSILSATALGELVAAEYDVGAVVACQLFVPSLTHTYLVETRAEGLDQGLDATRAETTGQKYMLRVYRTGWRSSSDILYELDALRHLKGKGIPVSTPVPGRDGSPVRELPAPEGPRPAVLFTYAPGTEAYDAEGYARRYGRAVAGVHNAAADFESPHRRFRLDLQYLLDRQLAAIRPFLRHRPDDWRYVEQLAGTLRERIAALPVDRLETGFCHGDFHGGNAHLDGETITFFDFDCCGPGWRAYEIAVYRWDVSLGNRKTATQRWASFLEGYTAVRPLDALDLAAVPLFVAVRHLWWLGLQCGNARDWGIGYRGDRFFDRALTFLKGWEKAHLAGQRTRRRRSPPVNREASAHSRYGARSSGGEKEPATQ